MDIKKKINFLDIKEIEKIGKESLPIYFDSNDLVNILLDKEFIILKLSILKRILGFAICKIYDERLHIMSIAIDKKSRKEGYATKLIEELKKLNYKTISLYVMVSNIPAISLYEKNGFKQIKVMKDYYTTLNNADAYYYEFNQI